MMRKIPGLLASLALLLACGCDGYYSYPFKGQLVTAERSPVSAGMAVHVMPQTAGSFPSGFDSEFGITDDEGHFSGTLMMSTGWVPGLRPVPPVLHQLDVTMSNASQTVTIPVEVSDAQQSTVADGQRAINLGVITVPSAAATQPAGVAPAQ